MSKFTTADILQLFGDLDRLEGELAEATDPDAVQVLENDINDLLNELAPEVDGKIAALAHVAKRAEAEADLAKAYRDLHAATMARHTKTASRCADIATRLLHDAQRQGLAQTHRKSGLPFIESDGLTVALAKTPERLVVDPRAQWPVAWLVPMAPKESPAIAKKALQSGETREGFSLVTGTRLAIK